MDTLLCDYLVFIKENDQSLNYLQICGKSIAEIFGKKQQIKQQKYNLKKSEKLNFDYTVNLIDRHQMFYCNHMSRKPGLFRKSFLNKNDPHTEYIAKDHFSELIDERLLNTS